MIRTALALNLDQNGEILRSLSIPRSERLQQLETVALGVDDNLDGGTIFRRGLEGILSGVEAGGRELIARGVIELEGLAIGTGESVGERVEGQVASEGHGSDDIRGSDEGVGGGVSIIATSEVTVVRGDD